MSWCSWCEGDATEGCDYYACPFHPGPPQPVGPLDDPATPYPWAWPDYMGEDEKVMRAQAHAFVDVIEDFMRWLRDPHETRRHLHYSQQETLAHFDAMLHILT